MENTSGINNKDFDKNIKKLMNGMDRDAFHNLARSYGFMLSNTWGRFSRPDVEDFRYYGGDRGSGNQFYFQGKNKAYLCVDDTELIDVTGLSLKEASLALAVIRPNEYYANSVIQQAGFDEWLKLATNGKVSKEIRAGMFDYMAKHNIIGDLKGEPMNTLEKGKTYQLADMRTDEGLPFLITKTGDNTFSFTGKAASEKEFEKAYQKAYAPPKKLGLFERISDWWNSRNNGQGTERGRQYREAQAAYDRRMYQAKLFSSYTPQKPANVINWEKSKLKEAMKTLFPDQAEQNLTEAAYEKLMSDKTIRNYLNECQEPQATAAKVLTGEMKTAVTESLQKNTDMPESKHKPSAEERKEISHNNRTKMNIPEKEKEYTTVQKPTEEAKTLNRENTLSH